MFINVSKVGYSRRDAQPLLQVTNLSSFEDLFRTLYSRDAMGRPKKESNAPVFSLFPSSPALFLFFGMQKRATWESSYIRKKRGNL